ncbi:C40 family peptidase [Halomonas sp. A11-A]|jgi:cell wall-associated NlpC family hydrolase|uniref:C40 family peptidase n=1 Tax=Halomonas sp. A11-A TaxID=2183985 RepID=UPI000D70B349|nr:NlpC/P60 family protein [Halomonas sp. A11-A]PWV83127.1 cell wall-associated NlpC family hydrolase [Halomonas sp. A11-A]
MDVTSSCRALCVVVSLALLAGCASAPRDVASRDAEEPYFARQLPGISGDWGLAMSPVDNPILEARALGNPPPALIQQALLAQHERWVGTPYRIGGTSSSGIDCSALVQSVFEETFRVSLPRTTGEQVHQGVPVERGELVPGDLVFFRPPGRYDHVGIYLGEGRFLHASTSRGVMISELDNRYWQRYYWQARRTLEPTTLAQRVLVGDQG